MPPLSTAAPLRLVPPWRQDEARPPVYLVKAATLDERTLFEAELAGAPWNAPRVFDFQLYDCLIDAVSAWYPDEDPDRARLLDIVETAQRDPALLDTAGRQLLAALETQAIENWPAYAQLIGARRRRAAILPLRALKRFLVGVEDAEPAIPFETDRRDGTVSDLTLAYLDPGDLSWLGLEIYRRLYLSADEGKASAPLPSSPPGPVTSQAAGDRRTAGRAGKSPAKSGRKTRV